MNRDSTFYKNVSDNILVLLFIIFIFLQTCTNRCTNSKEIENVNTTVNEIKTIVKTQNNNIDTLNRKFDFMAKDLDINKTKTDLYKSVLKDKDLTIKTITKNNKENKK
jgi:hypothetical protein